MATTFDYILGRLRKADTYSSGTTPSTPNWRILSESIPSQLLLINYIKDNSKWNLDTNIFDNSNYGSEIKGDTYYDIATNYSYFFDGLNWFREILTPNNRVYSNSGVLNIPNKKGVLLSVLYSGCTGVSIDLDYSSGMLLTIVNNTGGDKIINATGSNSLTLLDGSVMVANTIIKDLHKILFVNNYGEWYQLVDSSISAVNNHNLLNNLDYSNSNHTGFEPTVVKNNLIVGNTNILSITGGTSAIIGLSSITIDVNEKEINHDNLKNVGVNTHAQIDANLQQYLFNLQIE